MLVQTPTQVVLAFAGEVALLLWSIRMVTTGVTVAFGGRLRSLVASGLSHRWSAFFAGVAVTATLQSSTATALMIGSFAAAGFIALPAALAMMLGANVGTTLIVQFVNFDIAATAPILLIAGYVGMRRFSHLAANETARAIFGVGVMFLALKLMQITMQPVEHSPLTRTIFSSLSADTAIALLLAAALSFVAHSSLAGMLVVISLANAGAIETEAALAMVLGCNLGTALNPLMLAMRGGAAALRAPVGNLATRITGSVIGLIALPALASGVSQLPLSLGQIAAVLHFGFNLAIAIVFLPLLPLVARILTRLLPDVAREDDPSRSRYLDEAALITPTIALSNATREILRMADVADEMLKTSSSAFESDDPTCVSAVRRCDDVLDSLYNHVQLYVGAIARDALSEADKQRLSALLSLAINLEHIGDIVEKNLMQMAAKRIRDKRRLPHATLTDIDRMHSRLRTHLHLAITVFISQDEETARRIVREKETFRDLERCAIDDHLTEMRTGDHEALAVSALRLDITRDLKRIDAHIAATVHGLLEQRGVLHGSRLMSAA